jgi:hypothetical protein
MQLTPLRVPKIGAFLKRRIDPKSTRSRGGGATDGQAVGRFSIVQLSRSSRHLYSVLAHRCRAAPIKAIERELKAGGAGCNSVRRLCNPAHTNARYAACGSSRRGSAKRSCSGRGSARASCLNSAIYECSRPTSRCSRPLRARDRALFDTNRERSRQLNGKAFGGCHSQPFSI